MPEIKNTFLKGKMNKDADERVLPSGEYKDALNIQIGIGEDGDAGSVHNILGNTKISNINIDDAKCIGSIVDTENEKIYWFIYGSDTDAIAEYDQTYGTIRPVIVDITKNILNFPNEQITAINILEGYLSWTDNNSEPKLIDIELFKSRTPYFTRTSRIYDSVIGSDRDIKEEDITVIRKKPLNAPTVIYDKYGPILQSDGVNITISGDLSGLNTGDTLTVTFSAEPTQLPINAKIWVRTTPLWIFASELQIIDYPTPTTATAELTYKGLLLGTFNCEIKYGEVLFEEKFVRFAYRLKYKNDQYSVMSPFSETIFEPYSFPIYNMDEGYNKNMVNSIRSITLGGIDLTDPKVKSVDILYKESNNTNVYIYKTIKKENLTNYNTPNGSIVISKENAYNVLPETQLFRQYDNVPYRAKASEIVANRLVFGNYTDGINIAKGTDGKAIDFIPSFNVETIQRGDGSLTRSIKTGRTYQMGVLFEDEYGRQTPVFSDESGVIKILYSEITNTIPAGRQFQVSMNSLPSGVIFDDRIKRFKYYIKDQTNEYYNLAAVDAYIDTKDNAAWIVFPSFEVNKIQEDDYIVFKKGYGGGLGIADENAKYKVLDIKDSVPDSMEGSRSFNDKFFVKVKRDDYIDDYLLSKLRRDEIESSDFHKVDYVPENSLFLTYVETGSTRTEYYFKYGNVYAVNTTIDTTPSTDSNINFGPMAPACAITLPAEYGSLVNGGSDYNFDDITGQVDKVYLKFKYDSLNHIYKITSFFFCYDISSGAYPTSEPAIFETVPTDNPLELYYETEQSYPIEDYTKPKILKWYNCFDFYGIESNRIKDDYNAPTIDKGARVSTVIDTTYEEKVNKTSLIFSGLFNARNDFNRLNEFNVAENITKNLNPEYGSIQKLFTRDTDLTVFCEDKVLKVLANKDALYNADGNVNLTSVNAVLGQSIAYAGEYGISKNPESFANYGYQIYFTDRARNAVLRLSMDGLTVISNYGMSDYFRDKFNGQTIQESVAFKEGIDGWTSRLSFIPESGASLNGKYYTFKNGEIWRHYDTSAAYNNFYDTQYDSKITLVYNQDASSIKNFKTLSYEGTSGWVADSIETDSQSGKITSFLNKEGKWFNNIQGLETNVSNIDPKEFSIQGLGNISSYTGALLDESTTIPTSTETLIVPKKVIGTYDIYSKQYIISFDEPLVILPPIPDCAFELELQATFDCNYAAFTVSDGNVGDDISTDIDRGSILSVSPSTYQAGTNDYTATITVPNGFTNSGETIECVDSAVGALPLFECVDAGLSIPDGTTGNTVTGTVIAGTIQSISPSAYQLGSNTYTATILVPSGYSNAGSTINCTDTAVGASAAYAQITGPTTGTTGVNITLIGEDQNFTGSTWSWTGGSAAGLTTKSITFNESSAGTVTYGVTIDGTYSDTHNVTWSTATPTLTCAGTGFNLADGITGDTITSSDYTITNGTVQSITPTTYQAGSTTYSIDILVPAGYTNTGSTLTCTDTATGSSSLPAFTCTDAGFAVADGTTGDTIGINTDATVIAGTLNSVNPATYQSGSATYTANITVPAGYSNAGATLTTCTDTATGSAALPTFTCTDANFQVSDGTVGDTIGIGSDATVSAGTLNSVSPVAYQAGSTTYTANITVPSGYSNAGATLTTCTNSATGTYPSFTTNSPAETSSSSACLAGVGTTRYHDGSGTYPTIGDTVYLTSTGTGTVGAGYYKVGALWIEVNSFGVVIDEGPC